MLSLPTVYDAVLFKKLREINSFFTLVFSWGLVLELRALLTSFWASKPLFFVGAMGFLLLVLRKGELSILPNSDI